MRFRGLKGRRVGPFESIDVDLDAIPGLLIAVTGPNGSGKTTFCNLFTGCLLFREGENLGALLGLAKARDSFLEGSVVNGKAWTIRHELDGVSGKGETVVLDADGFAAYESRKVSAFDDWAAKTLPPPEVLYASTISTQKSRGFLEMRPAERLAILLRAIGAEKLERRAKSAREKASEADKRIDVTAALLEQEKERAGGVKAAEEDLAKAIAWRTAAEMQVDGSAQRLEGAKAEHEIVSGANAQAQAQRQELESARALEAQLGRQLSDLDLRVRNNRDLIGRRGEVEAAAARSQGLDEEASKLAVQAAEHKASKSSADRERLQHAERAIKAGDRVAQAWERGRAAKERLARREDIDQAVANVERYKIEEQVAEQAVTDAFAAQRELHSHELASVEDRIGSLRDTLTTIRDGLTDFPKLAAQGALESDDDAVAAATELPGKKVLAAQAIERAATVRTTYRSARERAEAIARLAPTLEAAAKDLERAEKDAEQGQAEVRDAEREQWLADERCSAAHAALFAAEARLAEIAREREPLRPLLALAQRLAEAEARLAEIEPQQAATRVAWEQAHARLEKAMEQPIPSPAALPDVSTFEAVLKAAENALGEARTAVALGEKALEQARASQDKRAELEASLGTDREAKADWLHLAIAIDQVKLLEVDHAGPALTREANELLHSCVGPRFTVAIETQRPDADGKKMIDGVQVRVMDAGTDAIAPREGLGESFSPGEQVLLTEAISLSLAILYCDKTGVTEISLIRDETGSALDPENARGYIAMLRRAASKVGARHVLFVSHSPEIQQLADARIVVEDGRLRVET